MIKLIKLETGLKIYTRYKLFNIDVYVIGKNLIYSRDSRIKRIISITDDHNNFSIPAEYIKYFVIFIYIFRFVSNLVHYKLALITVPIKKNK